MLPNRYHFEKIKPGESLGPDNIIITLIIFLIILMGLLICKDVYAAPGLGNLDGSLDGVSNSIGDMIHGNLGKIIAMLALLWAIIGCVFKFNIMLIFSLFGVLILLAFGVSIIDGVFV